MMMIQLRIFIYQILINIIYALYVHVLIDDEGLPHRAITTRKAQAIVRLKRRIWIEQNLR